MCVVFVPLLVFFCIPDTASAQVVNCTGYTNPDAPGSVSCGTCELVGLIGNGITFIIAIFSGIATLLFAWAGFLMLSSRGSTAQVQKGKAIFGNVLVGLLIMLSAWLIVDVVMKGFLPDGQTMFGPWNEVTCTTQVVVSDSDNLTSFADPWEGLDYDYAFWIGVVEAGNPDIPDGYFDYIMLEKFEGRTGENCINRFAGVFNSLSECEQRYQSSRSATTMDTALINSCNPEAVLIIPPWAEDGVLDECSVTDGVDNDAQYVGAWGTNNITRKVSDTEWELNEAGQDALANDTFEIIKHAYEQKGAASFVMVPPNENGFSDQRSAVILGINRARNSGYSVIVDSATYNSDDLLHITGGEASRLSRRGNVFVGDSNAQFISSHRPGATFYGRIGWSSARIRSAFTQ
jgi:hypothetical protein